MTDKIFVDSNVWIYLFTNDDGTKCKIAEHFILENSINNILVISYQVINEVTNVLKKKGFTESQIRFVIESMSKICIIQDYSKDIILQASALREKHAFSFWDSLIIAGASTFQCSCLVSEDMQDNRIINKVIIRNIFKV
jgi:predicted nucleic acid-binding protein